MANKKTTIERIWKKQFDEIMSDSFAKYAKYIIQDRALPDIRDGLKPVQRRILYAMYNLGLFPEKQHKKSATTVGEVIGKFHPHGDSSIYEALVRMSQWWKNNIPLIDMQGNNGSIDGDSPAAMRYTEAKFSLFGSTMLTNIEKETVKFVLNFDDSEYEPTVLPSLLPNLLVNGATGIAAGYATNIAPFNLGEVIDAIILRIDSPNCRLDSLIKVMPGPDFPTGAIIHDDNGIREAYETGKGKIIIRAKMHDEIEKNKSKIVITEIPFETNKSNIVRSIEEIASENQISYLTDVRDESDKQGIRIVIEYKGDLKNAESIKKFLFKNTQLQTNYNFNHVVIDKRKPIQMPLVTYLDSYLDHATEIITRSAKFDLNKASARLEVVAGLIKATSVIDQIIKMIRLSEDRQAAIDNLIKSFKFTPRQAEAIVQLRLYRLTNTDVVALQNEIKELEVKIENLQRILQDESFRKEYLKNILRQYKKAFATPRKSEIQGAVEKIQIEATEVVENKDMIIFVTRSGYIKSSAQKTLSWQLINSCKLKEDDALVYVKETKNLDRLLLITNLGNFIVVPIYKLKEAKVRDLGTHINTVVTLRDSEKIIFAKTFNNDFNDQNLSLLIATKSGMVKRFLVNDALEFKVIKPSVCMGLKNNDAVVDVQCVDNEKDQVVLISEQGNALRFNVDEVSVIGLKGIGVRGIKLREGDNLVGCCVVKSDSVDSLILLSDNAVKRVRMDQIISLSRATMGKPLFAQIKSNPYRLINTLMVRPNQRYFASINKEGIIQPVKASEIPLMNLDSRMSAPYAKNIIYNYLPEDAVASDNENTTEID